MIKTVELFAGSKSFSRVAAMYGCETFAVDWKPYEGIDLVTDIGSLDLQTGLPYVPNVIWASPDCTTYSKAAGRIHRIKGIPVSNYAAKCDEVNTFFFGSDREVISRQSRPNLFHRKPARAIPQNAVHFGFYASNRRPHGTGVLLSVQIPVYEADRHFHELQNVEAAPNVPPVEPGLSPQTKSPVVVFGRGNVGETRTLSRTAALNI